tara:strand:+ start:18 stop:272 length:255 start_codon:yes stop_codon:yes gene_type:complete
MKDKNLLDDIEIKSLEELHKLANRIIDNLDKKSNEEFIKDYQELIKLNNLIEKKLLEEKKSISKKTKARINEIISNGKETKKTI